MCHLETEKSCETLVCVVHYLIMPFVNLEIGSLAFFCGQPSIGKNCYRIEIP